MKGVEPGGGYNGPIKTRWGSPVDCRPSSAEAPPIGRIYPFSKIAVTLEPVMQFLLFFLFF